MKKTLLTLIVSAFLLYPCITSNAQDLPLFTQKLTNSFLYNPSVAGNGLGSVSLSNRSFWSHVPGAPKSNFLSAHIPFGYHKFGAGVSLLQEKISIYDNMFINGAFAYHLPINEETILSMGVSSEFAYLKINTERIDVVDPTDVLLVNPGPRTSVDFSFGVSFRSRFFDAGISTNRLATALSLSNFETQITQFYTGYIFGKFQANPDHLLEPMFTYRHLTDQSAQWDAGLFYTHRKSVILGISYRQDGIISPALGLKFKEKYMVGYSFEMFGSGLQPSIGATNEITLRMDFWDNSYAKNTRNSEKIMENAVAFRRKTMTTNSFRSKPISASSTKYKKRLKRNYVKSPNYRISNSNKLNNRKSYNPRRNKAGFFSKLFKGKKSSRKVHSKPMQKNRKRTPGTKSKRRR